MGADLRVDAHGSMIILVPTTDQARAWCAARLGPVPFWFNRCWSYAVAAADLDATIDDARAAGLEVR